MPEHETAAPWSIPYPSSSGETKLGATDMQEIAERVTKVFGEKTLLIKTYAEPATLKSGELALQTKSGETFTLPSVATANQVIGVFCGSVPPTTCKVTTSGGALIFGDFVNGAGVITLTTNQHVILQNEATNWIITAGEPRREQTYGTSTLYTSGTEIEPSATREAHVILTLRFPAKGDSGLTGITVGGAALPQMILETNGLNEPELPYSFLVMPGQKWKAISSGLVSLHYQTILR